MNNLKPATVSLKPDATPSKKTRSATALQELVASVFLSSGDPVIEHVMSKSRPVAVYGKLDQVK